MTPVSKKDRPKLLALLGGVVLVFFFVFRTVAGPPALTPPAKPPVKAAAPTTLAQTGGLPDLSGAARVSAPSRTMGVDPFRVIFPKSNPSSLPPPRPAPRVPVRAKPSRRVAPLPVEGLEGLPSTGVAVGGGGGGALPPAAAPVAAAPGPKLLGVVTGPRPLAVVQIGTESHFVRTGDILPGGILVEAVERDAVRLKKAGTRVRLTVPKDGETRS